MSRLAGLLPICFALLLIGQAGASPAIVVNGAPVVSSQPPINRLGVTLLPMRPVLKALGAQAQWWPKERKLEVRQGERIVELWVGTPVAQVNRVPVQLDVPPLLIGGTTYLPLKAIAQALQAAVVWNPQTGSIVVNTSPATP